MWKQNKLAPEGEMLKNALLNNKDFDPTTIAQNIIDFVTKDDNKIYTNKENKRNKLKKSMSLVDDLQSKIDILKDSYSGETLYVLSCGPSLGEYDKEYLKDFLADKPNVVN